MKDSTPDFPGGDEQADQIEEMLLNALNAAKAAYESAGPEQKKTCQDAYMEALKRFNEYVTGPGAAYRGLTRERLTEE